MLTVLAQTTTTTPGDPFWAVAVQYGVLGLIFLAFMAFVRHQIWVVIPNKEKRQEEREKAAADERAAFLAFNLKTQEEFEKRLTAANVASAHSMDKITTAFEKHIDSCEERCDERHAEIVATQKELLSVLARLNPNGFDRDRNSRS